MRPQGLRPGALAPLLRHWGLLFPAAGGHRRYGGFAPTARQILQFFQNNAFLNISNFCPNHMFVKFLIHYLLPWSKDKQ